MPIASDVIVDDIASISDGCTGADLKNLCREAALSALEREGVLGNAEQCINMKDFITGREKCNFSYDGDLIRQYEAWTR